MDLTVFGRASVDVAVIVSLVLSVHLAHRHAGVAPGRALTVMAALAVVTLGGGRIHYVLNHPGAYSGRWLQTLRLWEGGFHLPGGIVALVLLAPVVCRRLGVSPGRFGDAITPAITAGIAVTRLGCTIAGCCTGEVCAAPWCVSFPRGSAVYGIHRRLGLVPEDAARSLPVLPVQVGFLAVALALTGFAVWLERHKRYDGQVALTTMTLFAASTAMIEPFRGYVAAYEYWGPLPKLVWETAALAIACGAGLVAEEFRQRRVRPDSVVVPRA